MQMNIKKKGKTYVEKQANIKKEERKDPISSRIQDKNGMWEMGTVDVQWVRWKKNVNKSDMKDRDPETKERRGKYKRERKRSQKQLEIKIVLFYISARDVWHAQGSP